MGDARMAFGTIDVCDLPRERSWRIDSCFLRRNHRGFSARVPSLSGTTIGSGTCGIACRSVFYTAFWHSRTDDHLAAGKCLRCSAEPLRARGSNADPLVAAATNDLVGEPSRRLCPGLGVDSSLPG